MISREIMFPIATPGPAMKFIGFGFNSVQKSRYANNEINDATIAIVLHISCFERIKIPDITKVRIVVIHNDKPVIFTVLSFRNLSNNQDFLDHPK